MSDQFVATIACKVPEATLEELFAATVERAAALLGQLTPAWVKIKAGQWNAHSRENSTISRWRFNELQLAIDEFDLSVHHLGRVVRQVAPVADSEYDVIIQVDAWPDEHHISNLNVRVRGGQKIVVDGLKVNFESFFDRVASKGVAGPPFTERPLPGKSIASSPEDDGASEKARILRDAMKRGEESVQKTLAKDGSLAVRDLVMGASEPPRRRLSPQKPDAATPEKSSEPVKTRRASQWLKAGVEAVPKTVLGIVTAVVVGVVAAWLGFK